MPYAPKRPCRHPGCTGFCEHGHVYCPRHEPEYGADAVRGNASFRGYDSKWRTARARFLQLNPLCVKCMEHGILSPATVVDHIVPHRGDQQLFWDEKNWQPLCKDCHDHKTGSGL